MGSPALRVTPPRPAFTAAMHEHHSLAVVTLFARIWNVDVADLIQGCVARLNEGRGVEGMEGAILRVVFHTLFQVSLWVHGAQHVVS